MNMFIISIGYIILALVLFGVIMTALNRITRVQNNHSFNFNDIESLLNALLLSLKLENILEEKSWKKQAYEQLKEALGPRNLYSLIRHISIHERFPLLFNEREILLLKHVFGDPASPYTNGKDTLPKYIFEWEPAHRFITVLPLIMWNSSAEEKLYCGYGIDPKSARYKYEITDGSFSSLRDKLFQEERATIALTDDGEEVIVAKVPVPIQYLRPFYEPQLCTNCRTSAKLTKKSVLELNSEESTTIPSEIKVTQPIYIPSKKWWRFREGCPNLPVTISTAEGKYWLAYAEEHIGYKNSRGEWLIGLKITNETDDHEWIEQSEILLTRVKDTARFEEKEVINPDTILKEADLAFTDFNLAGSKLKWIGPIKDCISVGNVLFPYSIIYRNGNNYETLLFQSEQTSHPKYKIFGYHNPEYKNYVTPFKLVVPSDTLLHTIHNSLVHLLETILMDENVTGFDKLEYARHLEKITPPCTNDLKDIVDHPRDIVDHPKDIVEE